MSRLITGDNGNTPFGETSLTAERSDFECRAEAPAATPKRLEAYTPSELAAYFREECGQTLDVSAIEISFSGLAAVTEEERIKAVQDATGMIEGLEKFRLGEITFFRSSFVFNERLHGAQHEAFMAALNTEYPEAEKSLDFCLEELAKNREQFKEEATVLSTSSLSLIRTGVVDFFERPYGLNYTAIRHGDTEQGQSAQQIP